LLWYNGGTWRFAHDIPSSQEEPAMVEEWEDDTAVPASVRQLWADIGDAVVHDSVKQECAAAYSLAMGQENLLLACGVCGVRALLSPDQGNFEYMDLRALEPLQLSPEQIDVYEQGGAASRVASVTKTPFGLYHLHPELVEEYLDDSRSAAWRTVVCTTCSTALASGSLPELSIAAGVDYGWALRLGLPKLNLIEKYLISRVRLYVHTVKLKAGDGVAPQQALVGHVAAFQHDGPQVMGTVFPNYHDITDHINVKFVGDNSAIDVCMPKLLRSKVFRVNLDSVYHWLRTLKAVHPLYHDITIDSSPETRTAVSNVPSVLLACATRITDPTMVQVERHVGSDVAAVRPNPFQGDCDPPCQVRNPTALH